MECATATPPVRSVVSCVLLDLAILQPLDYVVPLELQEKIHKGSAVMVSLRGKPKKGYVVALKDSSQKNLVPVTEVLPELEAIAPALLELAEWIATYYLAPLPQVLKTIFPASRRHSQPKEQFRVLLTKTREEIRAHCIDLHSSSQLQVRVLETLLESPKKLLLTELLEIAKVSRSPIDSLQKKGYLTLEKVRLFRSPLQDGEYFPSLPKLLSEHQAEALQKIGTALQQNLFAPFLLFGVTGSGKTEIYLQAIERAQGLGKGTIMLVPEIALTVQTIERFKSRFPQGIAILHHRLSDGERQDEWERIEKGEASIVIGPRSALFSNVRNLGLLIVDEEQEGAYKQSEKMPCYNARDIAVMRAKMHNAIVILGSATPSMESFYNASTQKYTLINLPTRASNAQLPQIQCVDMRPEYEKTGFTLFSGLLIEKMQQRLEKGEQTILFLNRRGYHTTLSCEKCGFVYKCSRCAIAYTFHFKENTLSCHLCDEKKTPPKKCSDCKKEDTLKYRGVGTELVERSLHALLPGVRTLRMDADTTRHKGSHEIFFREFRTGKSDVLIGTQMVAKGLHFPSVTLVALLNADSSLHIPDFRSAEQTYQLLTQVAGRAGRGELPGEVIIQTCSPEHPVIQLALKQDFESFFHYEITSREHFGFPPFTHFIKFLFESAAEVQAQEVGQKFRQALVKGLNANVNIYPLVPAGHPKIKDIYRFQFLLKGGIRYALLEKIEKIKRAFPLPREVFLTIDVDPFSTFF